MFHIDIDVCLFDLESVNIDLDTLGVCLELGQTYVQFFEFVATWRNQALDNVNLRLLILNIDIEGIVAIHEIRDIDLDIVSIGDEEINISLKHEEVSLARLPFNVDGSDTFVKAHQNIVE